MTKCALTPNVPKRPKHSDLCPGADDTIFAPGCASAIPTVSTWGLVVTALLLLIAGKIYFAPRARRAA